MRKIIPAQIQCPSCSNKFNVQLYRTIWIEYPKNRELIFNNKINSVTCPSCKETTRLEFPFLCTNVKKGIAIWYEPYHDAEIDKDIALYKSKMGANSFYAKALRVQDWEEFKEKLIEIEQEKGVSNRFDVSEDMSASFSDFMKQIKKENGKKYYPKFLKHLSTIKGRLAYSFLPFLLLLFALYLQKGASLISQIQLDLGEFLAIGLAWYIGSFIIFTLLHISTTKFIKYWGSNKNLRLWSFGSIFWGLSVFLYVIIIEPYGIVKYMDEDEYFHMVTVMLLPPLLVGSAKYVYEKHIK